MTGDRRVLRNFVGGEYTDTKDGATEDVVEPVDGRGLRHHARFGPGRRRPRLARRRQSAFEAWRETTPSERSLALFRIADAIEARAEELVDAECENTGKPKALTMSEEIPPMVDQIRFFAGACRLLEGRSAGEYMSGFTSYVRREPVGVCAQVTPWNYPMMMAVWKFAPAIAAGNTVVLKPAHTTPVSTLLLAEIAAEFVPPGVFNVVCGDRDTGRALVSHPVPQMVSITGSVRAGREVAIAAAAGHQAGAPRARGQGPGGGVRRRRRREGGRGHRHRRLLQRRPGLHRGHPGAGRAPASTTTSPPPSSSRPGARPWRAPRSRGPTSARSTTPTSWPGCGASSTALPVPRLGAHRRSPHRGARASSTSPRW